MIDSWAAIAGLGAWHGINPGMGWLFAVALALQERSSRAAWRALPALAAGHAASVLAALGVGVALGTVFDLATVGRIAGAVLLGFGIWRLGYARHPRFGGMRVGARDLAIWSFLMASAHGAGLMVVPFALPDGAPPAAHHHQAAGVMGDVALLPAALHTAAYLITVGLVAWVVYRKVGVGVLRRWWINLDLVWALALVVTGVVSLVR